MIETSTSFGTFRFNDSEGKIAPKYYLDKKLKIWPLCICVTHRMHTDRVRVPVSSRNQEKQGSERLTTVSVTSKCAISKKLEASLLLLPALKFFFLKTRQNAMR